MQIGAVDSWGENCFNEFIWPRRHVHPKATITNNFSTDTRREKLYRFGEQLQTLDLEEGLMAFIDWLDSLGGNVILVAHKCLDFDAKVGYCGARTMLATPLLVFITVSLLGAAA